MEREGEVTTAHPGRRQDELEHVPSRAEIRRSQDRSRPILTYEAAVVLPFLVWLLWSIVRSPQQFAEPEILAWAIAITIVDLLPVPTSVNMAFSLSFPLELSAALIYAPPVAGLIAFAGAADMREVRGELPPLKALFIRAQIAVSVVAESFVFHGIADLHSAWYVLIGAVLLAAALGYLANVLLVAYYAHLQNGESVRSILREMHVGVFGEFLVSYMGLALFATLVATSFGRLGIWSIAVFIAPLAFARQMFLRTHSLQVATDELAERQRQNEWQALHDALTGLPNRVLFMRRLREAIDTTQPGHVLAVMLMDLDHFKEINDSLGHHLGDELLKEIGPRLSTVLREDDLLARLGGDEFGLVLPNLSSREVVEDVAQRLLDELVQPLNVEGLALDVSGSIGISLYPEHSADDDILLRHADVAMYAAKEGGLGYEVFEASMDRNSAATIQLISHVRPGLEAGEFVLYYQPKASLADGSIAGVEALIRWQHPERGLVPPNDFIPMVERTVLLAPLTRFVLEEALSQWRRWADDGVDVPVAVNLSPRSLLDVGLPHEIHELLVDRRVPADRLTLELTESFLMADTGRIADVLNGLSDVGVKLSIDDFGTGYSSLSYLKRLPINEIKVDRSFVGNLLQDANDAMIVNATVELGRSLGLQVVAEGVEDPATWLRLAEAHCDLAQGFFISKPLPAEAIRPILHSRVNVELTPEDALRRSRLHAV
jgi:diguanylate cyclase (GGDEF)-like protein